MNNGTYILSNNYSLNITDTEINLLSGEYIIISVKNDSEGLNKILDFFQTQLNNIDLGKKTKLIFLIISLITIILGTILIFPYGGIFAGSVLLLPTPALIMLYPTSKSYQEEIEKCISDIENIINENNLNEDQEKDEENSLANEKTEQPMKIASQLNPNVTPEFVPTQDLDKGVSRLKTKKQ